MSFGGSLALLLKKKIQTNKTPCFNVVEGLHRKSQLWNSSSQPLESLQKFTLNYLTSGLAVLRPT